MEKCKVMPVGDQALVVEFGKTIDEETNKLVLGLADYLRSQQIKGVIEILPTYRSLMVFYDDTITTFWSIKNRIGHFKASEQAGTNSIARKIMVPCCYEREFGLDLGDMESYLNLSRQEIINIHSETLYKIYMLGFLPGFVYLGGLNEKIHMPRLSTPRTLIPERSVGIGGNQTGVYPLASPGGWRLIGRTPVDFYNPARKDPILCRAGDYIKFYPIKSEEYQLIRNGVEKGVFEVCFEAL